MPLAKTADAAGPKPTKAANAIEPIAVEIFRVRTCRGLLVIT